ncbi:MAG: RluA family pseudouridine synthase [Alphaproteobacteria bacterium]|nr:RluA family pseudouridine synthase [Alphaproteobacteria bacterium]
MNHEITHLKVEDDADGQRLDRWLKKKLPKTPYALIQKMLRTGQVRVDGKRAKAETRLESGQDVRLPPAEKKTEKLTFRAQKGDKEFLESITLFDDGKLLILNKPFGLAVQGGPNITRHIDGMLAELINLKGVQPRLVHRLDRDTSGILVCGRSLAMTRDMGDIFVNRDIKKIYWAIVSPAPPQDKGEINGALIKGTQGNRKEAMVIDNENGKASKTMYRVIERTPDNDAAFIAFWPRTGRMHQIRIHTADILGCPIIGDEKYDCNGSIIDKYDLNGRLHLHAARLMFRHPGTGEIMDIRAPLADDLQDTWKKLGFNAAYDDDPFADIIPKDLKPVKS